MPAAGCQPSGEQVRAALRQLHERSAVVHFQPAELTARARPAAYSSGWLRSAYRNGPLIDVDAAILHYLRRGMLHQTLD